MTAPLPIRRPTREVARALLTACMAGVVGSCGFLPISKMSFVGTEVLEAAPKPPPHDSAFDGCGDAGAQPDYTLNRLKNRVDEGKYLPISWKVIARLPWPRRVGYRFRHQWTEGETKQVQRFEGRRRSRRLSRRIQVGDSGTAELLLTRRETARLSLVAVGTRT